jgi:hypothetical protein
MAGAKTYEIQVDTDVNFVGAAAPVSTNNSRYAPTSPPPFDTNFFWHVRGLSAQGVPTQWSEPWSYQMTWAGPPPDLVTPPDANPIAPELRESIEEIVLDWDPVAGASAYEVQISPDDQFNAPIGGTRVVRATTLAPNPTLPAGAYFWRVRALSTSVVPEPGVWSEIRMFTRAWPAQAGVTRPRGTDGAGMGLLPQVEQLLPAADDFSLSEPNFTWTPQREASHYRFQVGTDPNFSPGPPLTFDTCLTNHAAFTTFGGPPLGTPPSPACTMPKLVPGKVLYWRVQAVDGLVNGVFSEMRRFMYDPAVALVTPTSPANGSIVNGAPVLRWQPVDNISRYKVTIDPSDADCPTVTAFTYNTDYVPEALKTICVGPIAWTVQAVESSTSLSRLAVSSSWPTFTLGTQASAGPSIEPVVTTDIDGDSSTPLVDLFTPPLMQWRPVTNATHYMVFASIAGANSYSAMNVSTNWPAFIYTGENSPLPTLLDGTYDFYVRAYSITNAVLDTSALSQFRVDYQAFPTLLGPANCLVAQTCTPVGDTPTLDWTSVPFAGSYLVYLATDPNFTNITRIWTTGYSQLTPVESLPDSQAGQATYWFIRPCFAPDACAAFDTRVFPRAHAFRKTSAPIDAVTPAVGDVVTDEVTFTWKDYLATNDALTPKATQEARNYQVQVSTTAGFTNIIDLSPPALVDQTTYTAQTTTYPDGPLFWRVRAFDNGIPGGPSNTGNPLTFSPVSAFTKESGVPTLTAPGPESTQSGAPVLTWDPMPFTSTYAVEIYKNLAAPLATANRVVSITTRTAAAVPTTTLPKGNYGWRVQRLDVNGKAGAWTSPDNEGLRLFTVGGPVPALTSPVSGTKIQDGTLVLQWAAAAGASRYLVEASTSPTFTAVIESVTTDMTSWAPGQISPAWPDSTIYWRVSSLDATGQRLATSDPISNIVRDVSTSGLFTGKTPTRVLNTLTGIGAPKAKLRAARTLTLTVPGVPFGATAVALNVAVTNPTATSYLTVYPSNGQPKPVASNLNFVAGQTIPNLVLVPLGPGNKVIFYNAAGTVDVVADLVGYFKPGTGAGFTGRAPTRVLNTLAGIGAPKARLGAGKTLTLTVPGLPVGTTAVALNVAVTGPTATSYLTVFPGSQPKPVASNLNFVAGQTIPNLVLVPVGPGGTVNFYNAAGTVNVVADIVGYFKPGTGGAFTGRAPTRVLNTLTGTGAPKVKLGQGKTLTLTVPGLPVGTTAVALNVAVTGPTATSYLTVYPGGQPKPFASNLNFVAGETIPNLVMVPVGPGNTVTFFNAVGTVNVVADLVGHYS